MNLNVLKLTVVKSSRFLLSNNIPNQFISIVNHRKMCSTPSCAGSTSEGTQQAFTVALIQSKVGKDRNENLTRANGLIDRAVTEEGARLVCLSECFNSPYGTRFFNEYAEEIPNGPTSQMLAAAAHKHRIYLVGGTYPERDPLNGHLYNTCTVWGPKGDMLLKYRKMHLFDIDIPNQVTFRESDVISSGHSLGTFLMTGPEENTSSHRVGVGICYDLRFGELARVYRQLDCDLLVYPGAFTMITGPMHWELLQRARATDNQVYVLGISPASGAQGYVAWGHSQITDPWGKVLAQAGHAEEIVTGLIDWGVCEAVRKQIPIWQQRRTDVYDVIVHKKPQK